MPVNKVLPTIAMFDGILQY